MVKKDKANESFDQSNTTYIRAMTSEELKQFHQKTYEKFSRILACERSNTRRK
ncbi:hypothetical protein [Pseudalkalibacillus decolorationis]|uniref:hypothetical protein n=1 Tax=Pseudalkalibacillus decolorationis TaxID=163879 RepID=UPI002148192C|nr:hypothetical protein [Pseudalkalibacillus decolorationis]